MNVERVEKGELPLSAQSAFCAIPISRNSPKQFTYFNNDRKTTAVSAYDRIFNCKKDYDKQLHRCDREHARSRGLQVDLEERKKSVPILTSSIYGHRLDHVLDVNDRKHVRVIKTREFNSRNGISYSGTDHMLPA